MVISSKLFRFDSDADISLCKQIQISLREIFEFWRCKIVQFLERLANFFPTIQKSDDMFQRNTIKSHHFLIPLCNVRLDNFLNKIV